MYNITISYFYLNFKIDSSKLLTIDATFTFGYITITITYCMYIFMPYYCYIISSLICNAINNIIINIFIITFTLPDDVTIVVIITITGDSCFITIYFYLVTCILAGTNCDIPVDYITYLYCYYFCNFF